MDCLASLDHFFHKRLSGPAASRPGSIAYRDGTCAGGPEICYFALLDLGVSIGGGVAEIIAPEGDNSVHICVADPCIKGMGVSRLVIRKICQGLPIYLDGCGIYVKGGLCGFHTGGGKAGRLCHSCLYLCKGVGLFHIKPAVPGSGCNHGDGVGRFFDFPHKPGGTKNGKGCSAQNPACEKLLFH